MTEVTTSDTAIFTRGFDRAGITLARHAVAAQAVLCGLAGARLADFVLAVNELVTNAVRHGGGHGQLSLVRQRGVLWCEVSDEGPGLVADRAPSDRPPPATATGGRGLWLVRHLCDRVTILTGPSGTAVQVEMDLIPRPSP